MSGNLPTFIRYSVDGLSLDKFNFDFVDEGTYFTYSNGAIGIVVPADIALYIANSTSNTIIKVPTQAQKDGQYFLHANGGWYIPAGGANSSTPGGSNTCVQFNDSGSFGGSSEFTWNKTNKTLSIESTTINSTSYTGSANNTAFVGTISAANVVSNSQLSANLVNYVTGSTLSAYQTLAGLASNVAALTSNNTSFVGSISAANVVSNTQLAANLTNYALTSSLSVYQTTAGLSANVAALTSNNTSFVGTVSAANVVANAQLAANLANYALSSVLSSYQTTAGLSANVATLIANNTSFVGTVSAANVVSNTQLAANLANYALSSSLSAYQTTAGLSGNVAGLTSNNTSFVGSVTAANVVSNAQLIANLANYALSSSLSAYQTTVGLASNVATLTSNNTSFVGSISAANVVSNAQLSSNLANYAALSSPVFNGTITVGNTTVNTAVNSTAFSINGVPIGGASSPGGPTEAIQFNTSGSFNGNDSFTYNSTTNTVSIGNSSVNATVNSTVYTGTSNNTSFVGTVSAANVVSNAQLSSNLASYALSSSLSAYQTTAGLSGNVAVLTSNNTSFVGSISAANVVSNAQLSSNLSNYQTTAGLASNVAVLSSNSTSFVGSVGQANVNMATVGFVIDGGGAAITTGMKGYIEIPFGCTINRVTLLGDQTGSIVVDIFKCTYADFDPTTHPASSDKITASAPPTISTAKKSQDATLTGWTTTIAAGDILGFNVNSITTLQRVTISLKVTKT